MAPIIRASDLVIGESATTAELLLSLSEPSASSVTVEYSTVIANNTFPIYATATLGTDYLNTNGSLTFAPGETTRIISIPVINDTTVEQSETFHLYLSSRINIERSLVSITVIDNDRPSGTPRLSVADAIVDEKAGLALVSVILDRPSASIVSVAYATTADSAFPGSDFTSQSGQLVFQAGETSKTISILINDDADAETAERFNLLLSSPVASVIADGAASILIGANDGPTSPFPVIRVADITVSEGDPFAELVFSLSAPSSNTVRVPTAIGSTSGGELTFAPGQTTLSVRVPLFDDTLIETNENSRFTLVAAPVERHDAYITVIDNDQPSGTPLLSVVDAFVDEKVGLALVPVTLDRPSTSVVSVDYATTADSATPGSDFTRQSGQLVFLPGQTSKTISILISDDADAEPAERFNLVLSSPVASVIADGAASILIGANDGPTVSTPLIRVADITVSEADRYADLIFSLSAPSAQAITLNGATRGVTSGSGGILLGGGAPYTFAPGQTILTARVLFGDDVFASRNELISFDLYPQSTNALLERTSVSITRLDNDQPSGTPLLSVVDAVIDEKAGLALVPVTLDRPSTSVVSVDYATTADSATPGSDFTSQSGQLVFLPGQTSKTISILINDDADAEPAERFNLVLSSPVASVIADGAASILIGANDGPTATTPLLRVADITVNEAGPFAELIVSLSSPSSNTVRVGYSTSSDTAAVGQDFYATSGTLTFTPGETTRTIRIPIKADTIVESSEVFLVNLSAPTNAQLERTSTSVTIIDSKTSIGNIPTVRASSLFSKGRNYDLSLKDYDGNPHGYSNAVPDGVANGYKFQGEADVNRDGLAEGIFTNRESGRWATIGVDPITGAIDYSRHGQGGNTRVVGIYIDPLVAEGEANGGFLLSGEVAPKRFGPFDSQRRFQNDLRIDNLTLKTSGDFDNDGFQEVYWRVNDGTAYLRSIMHADGNIQYANYQNEAQMRDYLTATGNANVIQSIL